MKKILTILCMFITPFIWSEYSAQHHSKSVFEKKSFVEGEMLVQISAKGDIRRIINNLPSNLEANIIEEVSKPMRVWLIQFNHQAISHEKMMDVLYDQKDITLVDLNHFVEMRSTIPGDPQFGQQWHHVNTGQTGGTADADIDSDEAWDITTGGTAASGEDIVVCIIESTNLNHTDLDANKWVNTVEIPGNGIDDDGNGYIDDIYGWNPGGNNGNVGYGTNTFNTDHGTSCAGMIGAVGDNGIGVVGANWDVKIMIVTVGNLTQANVIASYTYPLIQRQRWNNSNGADGAFVVATSASWGIDQADPSNYPLWCNFYDTLGLYGIINVGATSNSNVNVDIQGDMPTACPSPYMVGVGRTDHNDNTAGGYGVNTINFGAPGINVRTTANSNGYTTTTGTSFSCPLTAGVVALAYAIPCPSFMAIVKNNPQQGADLVLQALNDGVDQKPQLATRFVTGGRLNAKNTLDELMTVSCSGNICLTPSSLNTSNILETSANITWNNFSGATESDLYYREAGSGSWTHVQNPSSPYSLTNLMPCTAYEFYMQSICDQDSSGITSTVTFSTSGCGNCIDLPYCTNNATDAVDEWIASVEIGSWLSTTGNDNGYGDYTNGGTAALTLDIGSTYSTTLTPAWGGTLYNEQFKIWIDLDQNGTFDAGDLVYDQGTATQTPATGTITIPATATIGSTRMRVQMAYIGTGQTAFPGVCGSFQWGEVEDYCIELVPAVICNYTAVNTVIDPTCADLDNGSISVNISGGTAPYTYAWDNAATTSSINNLSDGAYEVVVTDATGCDTTMSFQLDYTTQISLTVNAVNTSCNGSADGSVTALATGSTGFTYLWDNSVTTANNDNLEAGNYTVTVSDNDGCTATSNGVVGEPAPVSASFTSSVSGTTVNFTNTSSTGSYSWDFGDGNTSTMTNPSNTYPDYGTYTVCLTVTSSCGNQSTCNDVTIEDASSVAENSEMFLNLFPVPAKEQLFITEIPSEVKEIALIDISGKLIENFIITSNQLNIQLNDLGQGVYLLLIKDASGLIIATDKFNKIK
jgi:PKD repeat protein